MIILIILGVFGVCCIFPVFFGGFKAFNFYKNNLAPTLTCGIGMAEAQKAIHQYADDHGGKLPAAKTWQDDIRPYYIKVSKSDKDRGPLPTFPSEGNWICSDEKGVQTGVAYNLDVGGKKIADLKDASTTILLFEVEKTGQNQSQVYKARPKDSGPMMLGTHRPWMLIYVTGNLHEKNGDFNFSTSDDSDEKPAKSDSKDKSSDSSSDN